MVRRCAGGGVWHAHAAPAPPAPPAAPAAPALRARARRRRPRTCAPSLVSPLRARITGVAEALIGPSPCSHCVYLFRPIARSISSGCVLCRQIRPWRAPRSQPLRRSPKWLAGTDAPRRRPRARFFPTSQHVHGFNFARCRIHARPTSASFARRQERPLRRHARPRLPTPSPPPRHRTARTQHACSGAL